MAYEVKFLIQGKNNHIRFSVMKHIEGGGKGASMYDFVEEVPKRIADKFKSMNWPDVNYTLNYTGNDGKKHYNLFVGDHERGTFFRILKSFESAASKITVEDRSRNVVCIFDENTEEEVEQLISEIIDSIPERHNVRGEILARTTGIVENFNTYDQFFENGKRGIEAGNALGILDDKPKFVEGAKWPLAIIKHDGKTKEIEFEYGGEIEDHGAVLHNYWLGWDDDENQFSVEVEYLKSPGETTDIFWDTLQLDE